MRLVRPRVRSALLALALGGGGGAPLAAQAIGQGFELERQGRLSDAATVYLTTLRAEPANLAALLGLERVLPGLGRLAELLPLVRRAEVTDTANLLLRALELRVYAGLDQADSMRAAAERWIARAPGDESPWREWAVALEDQRQFDDARAVLQRGRRVLGRPTALAFELADLAQRSGDWESAATEWGTLVAANAAQAANAVAQLADAPEDQHEKMIRLRTGRAAAGAPRRLGAEMLLGWGDATRAWAVFAPTVATASPEAVPALRRFADRAATVPGPEAKRVRGLALSRFADLVPGALAAQARATAARALLDAGDRAAARAALERLAADPGAPADAQALAKATLVEILIADGQLDSAAATLAAAGDRLSGEDREALRYGLVRARLARGELDRAEQLLAADSSVDALALKGWVALYRGDLKRAGELFRDAGPYAGDRRRRRAAGRRAGVGAPAAAPRQGGGRGRAPGAPDPHLSHERGGPRGAARAGAGEGSDSAIMKRREFIQSVSRTVGLSVGADFLGLGPTVRLSVSPTLLIPMDDAQSDHLKAYGVAYRLLQAGLKAEWLLNYRGGSFLVPDGVAIRREAALAGVALEPVDDARVTAIRGEIAGANADAVTLEKAPKVAVYLPPNAPPC